MMPVCKRCMLADMDADGVYQAIQRRIAQMPEEQRADGETYRQRLACCRGCDALVSGLCGICGCFIELRAAKTAMHCPHPDHFW